MSKISTSINSLGSLVDKLNAAKHLDQQDWAVLNRSTLRSQSNPNYSITLDVDSLDVLATALSSEVEDVAINCEELISQAVVFNHLATVCNKINYKGKNTWGISADCNKLTAKGGIKLPITLEVLEEIDKLSTPEKTPTDNHSEFLSGLTVYLPAKANENNSTVQPA